MDFEWYFSLERQRMEKDGEDEEVFEIDDFTVITEFERFVVAVEALVQEWGLIGTRPRKKYPKVIGFQYFKFSLVNQHFQCFRVH